MKKNLIYYIVFNVNDPAHRTVRATYQDGTTRTWHPGDFGYQHNLIQASRRLNIPLGKVLALPWIKWTCPQCGETIVKST